jgi:hypothetical protein
MTSFDGNETWGAKMFFDLDSAIANHATHHAGAARA